MSGKLVKTLSEEHDQPAADSVFDFLYYDARRVGAFLAQLDPDGHLVGLAKTGTVSEQTHKKATLEGSGGVPGVVNAKGTTEDGVQEGAVNTAARTYDPLWAAPMAFLDYAQRADLLARDVSSASFGEFILADGTFSIIDMAMMKNAWEAPLIKKQIVQGSVPDVAGMTKAQANAAKAASAEGAAIGLEMIRLMPHGVQGQMVSGDGDLLWMMLDPASLTTPVGDLTLKHGVTLAGTWHVVGILDALPDAGASTALMDSLANSDLLKVALALSSTPLGTFAQALAPVTRMFMGRPGPAYGVTPILIFRSVQGRKQ